MAVQSVSYVKAHLAEAIDAVRTTREPLLIPQEEVFRALRADLARRSGRVVRRPKSR